MLCATGQLSKEIGRNGWAGSPGPSVAAAYTTTFAYSSSRLSTVTDAAGRTLTFSYGTNGKVSAVADSAGRGLLYGYDGAANLTDVTDVGGGNTHFTYDANHFLQTVRDPRGNTVETNTYDAYGRVTDQKDGLLRDTTIDYTSIPGATKVTDPKGNVTVDAFNSYALTSETKGYGTSSAATWTYTYDPNTFGVASVLDPNGHTTNYTWDPSGSPLTRTDALNHQTVWTYNSFGEPLTVTDAKNVQTTNTYDSAGNLTQTSTPLVEQPGTNQVTTYTHGDSAHPGQVTSITNPRSKTWSFTYDTSTGTYDTSTGDVLSQTTPLGDKTSFTYNGAGQRLTMVSPNGNVAGGNPSQYTTTYVPNAFGDVTSVTDPLGHQTQYGLDADRNLHTATDAINHVTTYTYDAANQLTTITRPDTTQLQNVYWPDGTLETQTDGASHSTSYDYDPVARLSKVTDPDNRWTQYTYYGAGNLKTSLDPASRTTTYGYDIADRLTSTSYSDNVTPNVSFTYDNDNQRLTMTDGTGQSSWTWDSLQRLTSQTDGSGQTMGYGYDLANNLSSISYPGSHTVNRVYDDAGRLYQVSDWLSHTTTFNYDHNTNLTSEAYPNTTTATNTPDAADRLMNITDAKSGTTFASFAYGRQNNDLLSSVTPTGVGQSNETYGYTSLNQLQTVNSGSYTFDSADNLTGTPSGTKLAYDNANQLCWTASTTGSCASPPSGATAYSYSSLGERTGMTPPSGNPAVAYGYDQASRLTELRGAGYRTAVLASAPLGYWRLGDASGTAAKDTSGNARTGTATSVTWGTGSALATDNNTAATFNGTSSYVDTGNLGVAQATATFTDEAWIKTSATQTSGPWAVTEGLSTGGTANNQGLGIDPTSGTKARFGIHDSTGAFFSVIGATSVTNGAWHHVVGVRNGSTLSLYVDGKLDAQATGQSIGTITADVSSLGALKRNNLMYYFNGSIDEAAIYPRALSQAEINGHYRAGQSNYAGTVAPNGPVGDWRLDETTGTTAADASGDGHSGTYAGGYTLGASGALTGDADKAVTLNGTTGYVNLGNLQVGTNSTFAVEAWVKSSTNAGWIVNEASTTSNNPLVGINIDASNAARFFVRDNANNTVAVTGTIGVTNNAWHHVVGVRNGTSYSLYVDGKADGNTTSSALGTISLNTTTIGAGRRSTVSGYLTGTIDEAAYYTSALDAATIARHYYNGTNSTPRVASYTYNGDGLRTSKTVNATKNSFTWDRAEGLPLLAYDGTTYYIYAAGGAPLEQITGTSVSYFHTDQQGSTRALTDQNGNVVATYTSDAYGNPAASSGVVSTPLRYDGEYRDTETGFLYLRARYYDPTNAQLLTRDPAYSLTRAAYAYVGGNPLNANDPSGLCWDRAAWWTRLSKPSIMSPTTSGTPSLTRRTRSSTRHTLRRTSSPSIAIKSLT